AEAPAARPPAAQAHVPEAPGAAVPGVEVPGAEVSGSATPGAGSPGSEAPGAEPSGPAAPGAQAPVFEAPDVDESVPDRSADETDEAGGGFEPPDSRTAPSGYSDDARAGAAQLPRTGADIWLPLASGIGSLAALGAGAVVVARKRRNA
ncbi:LPXTG cell wall anchor domain-containing protein, partial [Streptomyces phytophilus]|uniref:LPXTG cell wall anchor domain-containing protein n=1 Tax=Streptomyces phytophilus TaxID=722715 RepID=UPI0015EFF2DF